MVLPATAAATARTASLRHVRHVSQKQQRRGFIDWMVNYPDKVMEKKAIQMKGGTMLGQENPTWLKQGGTDLPVIMFSTGLTFVMLGGLMKGHYDMAYGVNKKE